jgi:hypothetical protein
MNAELDRLQRAGLHRRRPEQNENRRRQRDGRDLTVDIRDELTAPGQLEIAL